MQMLVCFGSQLLLLLVADLALFTVHRCLVIVYFYCVRFIIVLRILVRFAQLRSFFAARLLLAYSVYNKFNFKYG